MMDYRSKRAWAVILLLLQMLAGIILVAIVATKLDFSSFGLASNLDGEISQTEQNCAIGTISDSASSWLCNLSYATAGVGFFVALLLVAPVVAMCCGKTSRIWYRGGCYKFFQVFLLFATFIIWVTTASLITKHGLEANKESGLDGWRDASMVAAWIATICYALALLLRIFDEGGSVTRAELDKITAGEKVVEMKNRGYYRDANGRVRGWGAARLPGKVLHRAVLTNYTSRYQVDGYYPSTKDPRDKIFIPWHPRWYASWLILPKMVDLEPKMPEVLDQGQLGTCVVNSAANAYRYTVNKDGNKDFRPSRLFLYFNTKYHIMAEYPDGESGSFLRACCQALRKYGCCSEQTYPYNPSNVAREPPPEAFLEAKKHKVSYYTVPQTAYDIMSALYQGHPIMMAISFISSKLDIIAEDGEFPYLNYPTKEEFNIIKYHRRGDAVGHHAVILVGYDRENRVVKFQNSYGAKWGANGFFYAPLDYVLHEDLARDFWIFRKAR